MKKKSEYYLLRKKKKNDLTASLILNKNDKSKTKRLTKEERLNLKLESNLTEIIVGLLLGDGHIDGRASSPSIFLPSKGNANARFHFTQTSSKISHLNYFYHVFSLFKPFIVENKESKEKSWTSKKTNIEYKSISFATMSLPLFNGWDSHFYIRNEDGTRKKRVSYASC